MVKVTRQVRGAHKQTPTRQESYTGNTQAIPRYKAVKDIASRYSLGKAGVKHLFGLSEATQFRYEKENPILKPAIADRVERFNRIVNQAKELFEDEAETKRWLSTPKEALAGEMPLKVLATDAGAKQVEEILYRAEYGMYG